VLYVNPFPAQSMYSFIPNLFTFIVYAARIVLYSWISVSSSYAKCSVGWYSVEDVLFR